MLHSSLKVGFISLIILYFLFNICYDNAAHFCCIPRLTTSSDQSSAVRGESGWHECMDRVSTNGDQKTY